MNTAQKDLAMSTFPAFATLSSTDTISPQETLDTLRAWSEAGWLRRLDSALAAFMAELDPHPAPAVLVATALLAQMEGRGHSCLPLAPLLAQPGAVLGWPATALAELDALLLRLPHGLADWRAALLHSSVVDGVEGSEAGDQPLVLRGSAAAPRLYLRRYWGYEGAVAQQIVARTATPVAVDASAVRPWLDRLFASDAPATADTPADWQKLACALALRGRFSVITGGPGTGKTYTAARLLALLFAVDAQPERLRIALAAPTGKAAARLKQSIDTALGELRQRVGSTLDLDALTQRMGAARTLHSLLGARPDTRQFRYHAGQPLDIDVLIVDEASMVHLEMMAALLAALPPTARVVLLGDKDQLASVEAGAVLGDLCRDAQAGRYSASTAAYALAATGEAIAPDYLQSAGNAPPLAQHTVMLRHSRRFGGPIGALALAVNRGDASAAQQVLHDAKSGALASYEGVNPVAAVRLALEGRAGAPGGYSAYLDCMNQRPAAGDAAAHAVWVHSVLTAFDRFRLLCAVREGDWGAAGLNQAVQAALQHDKRLSVRGEWYIGRPVMVTRNDPALGVFNGDIGITLPAAVLPQSDGADAAPRLRVYFADGPQLRSVGVGRLAHVETAFAMTVHKSQGSEFEHTALVLPAHAGPVLSRELVYTGITRARTAFTLVAAQPGLLATAVQQRTQRASGLQDLLG
ncbi:MAG: exodeoxyribonuclease V subunit alpha [Giesbergeria sp.]|nr:exodeoxyribonuclease V subunit alpha [Giesbergeria sp.]MBP7915679.1 exodeoxyribonuclease V subunit alpha [Giesbergeria sp.]